MAKITILTDPVNGVSAIVTEAGDANKPAEIVVRDDANPECVLSVPAGKNPYSHLLELANSIKTYSPNELSTRNMLQYSVKESSSGVLPLGGIFLAGIVNNTAKGEIPGDFGYLAAPLKKLCAKPQNTESR